MNEEEKETIKRITEDCTFRELLLLRIIEKLQKRIKNWKRVWFRIWQSKIHNTFNGRAIQNSNRKCTKWYKTKMDSKSKRQDRRNIK